MARSFFARRKRDEVPVRGLPLARELLPLHVRPDLLGHVRWPDGRAAEHRLHGVRASLAVDRVAAARLAVRLRLRHRSSLAAFSRAGPAAFPEPVPTTRTWATPT